jgi:hypothetical protein
VKLRKDLGYDIDYIYSEKEENSPIEQKQRIIKELKEEFDLYYNKKKVVVQRTNNQLNRRDEKLELSGFHLNKELEETNKLIDKVLKKLEVFFA